MNNEAENYLSATEIGRAPHIPQYVIRVRVRYTNLMSTSILRKLIAAEVYWKSSPIVNITLLERY